MRLTELRRLIRQTINEEKAINQKFKLSLNERDSIYDFLDTVSNDLRRQLDKNIEWVGTGDVDSQNRATIQIALKPTYTDWTPNGGKKYMPEFLMNIKVAKQKLNQILNSHGVSIVQIYVPAKKYWKDQWGNKIAGYEDNRIEMEVKLPYL